MACGTTQNLHEVFSTEYGAVYQSDASNCFVVDFNGKRTHFGVGCFISFKKKVDAIDFDAMALQADKAHDMEIITPCQCEYCFVLDLKTAWNLKELLDGAKTMLELNSIIQERVYRVLV